jgi:hypothetical protein
MARISIQSCASLRGLPRFLLGAELDSPVSGFPASSASSSTSDLGFLGGRPRLRLRGGSEPSSSAFFCLGWIRSCHDEMVSRLPWEDDHASS